ncbi:hypothetical protein [Burkholderia lata]|uniref:hypothetical protein n=1 Tax=Burkholderia lata (strain ATCC 17760 / DSM 23089 / LMG 22485 / NCIMB 9086 / R18194 / 383) TaxID=482957 RepID=UPI0012EAE74A|nr:hypothetical protein [Burkholderia lata]
MHFQPRPIVMPEPEWPRPRPFRCGIAPRDGKNAARSVVSTQKNAEKLVTL